MNESAQFSPAQVLDAARRAEAEGRTEHAVKFYRHLADQYTTSPEGSIAVEALARLSPSPAGGSGPGLGYTAPHHPMHRQPATSGDAGYPSFGPAAVPEAAMAEDRGGGRNGRRRKAQSVAMLPEPKNGFFVGRALALLLSWGGVAAILAGAAIIGSMLAGVSVFLDFLGMVPGFSGLWTGAGICAAGVGCLFLGQFANAIFEIANRSREINDLIVYQLEQDAHQSVRVPRR